MTTTEERRAPIGLARLLTEYRERTGDSYATLSARTGFTRGYFGYLINAEPPFYVKPETLQRMSTGLGIPLAVLLAAACETCGYADNGPALPGRPTLLADSLGYLDDAQLDIIERLVASLRNQ